MTATTGTAEPELEMDTPYWQLDQHAATLTVPQLIRRLPASLRPVLAIIRRTAPRAALTIVGLQVASGTAFAFGLLATTGVLEQLFTEGPTADRVLAALPSLLFVVGAFAVRGLLDTGVALAHAHVVPAVRRAAEEQLVHSGLGVELAAFDDPEFYDRLHRARDRGVFYLERATDNLVELLGSAFAVLAAAGSLGVLHPVLLPVLALSVVPDGIAVVRSARLGYATMARTVTLNRRERMLSDLATEREPAPEIRACQAEAFVRVEYRAVADRLQEQETSVGLGQARVRAVGRALSGVAMGLTIVLLGVLLQAGWVPLAVAGTALIAIRSASAALGRLVLAANLVFEQGLYVADYETFRADALARTRPRTDRVAPVDPARIELHGVGFRYHGADRPALSAIDLTIHSGQVIALVGENGSGKTTLAKLITGLYRPTEGKITWDGVDLSELDPVSVGDRVGMVAQTPVRWPHDARTNIRLGRPERVDPDDAALRAAASSSGAAEVVAELPDGWRSLLSRYFRGGTELSGGQWQRLAVARGLFRDARVLVLDEPTAALDAKAEWAVYESLRRLAEGRTVVLITHRLGSVRGADRIYLLHEGELAEQGTHVELMASAGRYADMYRLQAALYAEQLPTP
ncbi:MAG TPA: ABC transporter ATP-binding protein [Actinophytocola sp.]|uniref:ABC transporter ATP-binding protein n=1 Tax=Actinophytocola sp. TaxID=1872138 RepID=UPI002F91D18D